MQTNFLKLVFLLLISCNLFVTSNLKAQEDGTILDLSVGNYVRKNIFGGSRTSAGYYTQTGYFVKGAQFSYFREFKDFSYSDPEVGYNFNLLLGFNHFSYRTAMGINSGIGIINGTKRYFVDSQPSIYFYEQYTALAIPINAFISYRISEKFALGFNGYLSASSNNRGYYGAGMCLSFTNF